MFEAAAQAARAPGGMYEGAVRPRTPAGATSAAPTEDSTNALSFLRNHSQFQQLRQLIQQQPQMLEQVITQLSAGNPQLATLINQHPEEFIQLLSDEMEDDAVLPPGAQTVHVTEEERDAIERVSLVIHDLDHLLMGTAMWSRIRA
jgi:UV excision repair protein RAD23